MIENLQEQIAELTDMEQDEELIKEEAAPPVRALFPEKPSVGQLALADSLQRLLDDVDSENADSKSAVIFF